MAKINLVLAGFLVSVLLLCFGITVTEERLLVDKLDEPGNVDVTNLMTNFSRGIAEEDSSAANVNNRSKDFSGDDFQPTTPGHSPGAGHSNGPASNDNN
ncbi:hypothetical protein HRI_001520600 [Hibiscus trionum]|uniref:Uncharacterized protein n=1 Tax=Hibiscus trionum TaxID=183268 RepID=A0A9W7LVX7_HIBTR|nr:hypothetical protein HRI_001520600 [Hibiscus trionum]